MSTFSKKNHRIHVRNRGSHYLAKLLKYFDKQRYMKFSSFAKSISGDFPWVYKL